MATSNAFYCFTLGSLPYLRERRLARATLHSFSLIARRPPSGMAAFYFQRLSRRDSGQQTVHM
jgi:hypothetical protein